MGTCEVQNEIKLKQNQMKRKPIEMNQYKQCVCVCVIERERGDYVSVKTQFLLYVRNW